MLRKASVTRHKEDKMSHPSWPAPKFTVQKNTLLVDEKIIKIFFYADLGMVPHFMSQLVQFVL